MGFDKSSKCNQLISPGDIINKNFKPCVSIVITSVFCRWKLLHYNLHANGREKNTVT